MTQPITTNNPTAKTCFSAACRISMLLVLICWASTGLAQSDSDLLIIVDEDGMGYTAQQTLFADDEQLVSTLPPGRQTLITRFFGPGSEVHRRAYKKDPNKLTLFSSGAFTRFRHRFDRPADELTGEQDNRKISTEEEKPVDSTEPVGVPVFTATLDGFQTSVTRTRSLTFRVSWILPPNLELLSFSADEGISSEPTSSWRKNDNVITYQQVGAAPTQLALEYRIHSGSSSRDSACLASLGPSEWCSPDVDNDGVPDYRDICIAKSDDLLPASEDGQDIVLTDNTAGIPLSVDTTNMPEDSLGCIDDSLVVLPQIQFEGGKTYLNAQARSILDKVAIALQRLPEKLYQIGTHTDNAGYIQNNQQLSDNRAAAIRHYLMLRGLGPNQLQARGYGETSPAYDNRTAEGRRANRRVELKRLN